MDLKPSFPTTEFCQKSLVQEWLTCCQRGNLLAALKKHWKSFVLVVFGNEYDQAKEDRLLEKFLFRPMEHFLCNGDPEDVFRQLKEKDTPAQICGRVFKYGEPTYSCRDCANDPTCVLCIDCFQKSVHKKHRYKMCTSGGGGYCDCGDVEAWKSEPYCDNHKPDQSGGTSQNPMEVLPDDLTDRASALFMAALRYTVEMLTWEQCAHLPADLQPDGELNDTYVTMLFNDEVHTYEQVINTLMRAVDCTQKQAVDFATTVDREGKSNVRAGTFANCEKARQVIEHSTSRHGSKALKVQVMHTIVVAHQAFAMKIIQWLQTLTAKSDGLRRLFCLLSMQPQEDGQSIMEKLLLTDTQLWKVARVHCHQLLMAGVLMDTECKKQFSILFTKWYPQMMLDFAQDDHDHDVCVASLSVQIFTVPSLHYATLVGDFVLDDHYRSVSITSLSVQIFTVPTLAKMLVTDYDLLNVIIQSFLRACEERKNSEGKLAFDRGDRHPAFKRACYMLYDIKYALTGKPGPADWTDKLRQSFLKGLTSFLSLLKMMQGMDSVIRQTGMHLEYEPEWEGAFNLQLKLNDIISEFLTWCGSDKQILIDSYKKTLEFLLQCKDKPATLKKEYKGIHEHKAKCLKYDVSSQPVSIHLPLSRFLAGLHLHLGKYNMMFHSPELGLDSGIDAAELIEPPLRVQVMIAQSQAYMWRRNGYGLQNQIFFYHNVKCRKEMYDKDIVMLQIGASVLESNEFIIHLLNKFGLLSWLRNSSNVFQEDHVRQTATLVEEFLNLLIVLIGERYVPGVGMVTNEDTVKREIIHQLCISPMAHSELSKALPENSNNETGIEEVIHNVATFKKPASSATFAGKGRFELKKESYDQYNSYFYHYSRSEQSKSEEAQIERKKQEHEGNALPPPEPPMLTPLFHSLTDLLQCDIMLSIMKLILQKTAATRSRAWTENQFDKILHLIGLALLEQRRVLNLSDKNQTYDFFSQATKEENSILSLLENLVGCSNITHDSSKDLLTWTLKIFIEVRQMKNEPVNMESLQQISSSSDQKSVEARKVKAEKAAKRRAKIMKQMSNMQKNFIQENADLFNNTDVEISNASSDTDISDLHGVEFPVVVGSKKSRIPHIMPMKAMCILCQEEQEVRRNSDKPMVLAAFIQRSSVLSQRKSKVSVKGDDYDPLFSPEDLNTGTYTSSCGHVMHADCWQRFFEAILARERRRPLRFRPSLSYNIDLMEFLCPLCESISNTVIPVIPPLPTLQGDSNDKSVDISFNDWLEGLQKSVLSSVKENQDSAELFIFEPCPLSTVTKNMAETVARNFQLLWEYVYDDTNKFTEGMTEMLKKFGKDVYTFGLNVSPDENNWRVPLMAWNTCAFTVQSIEQQLRADDKPLFGALSSRQSDCLMALIKYAPVCCQVFSLDTIKQHCLRLLSALLTETDKTPSKCILDIEMFHYMVYLTITVPSLYADKQHSSMATIPTGGLREQHVLQFVLCAHIVQILLTCDISSAGVMEIQEADAEGEALLEIYNQVRSLAHVETPSPPQGWHLFQYMKKAILPFLRCSAIFFHQLTEVPPPLILQQSTNSDEYEALCKYLGLPCHMSMLLNSSGYNIQVLIQQWCNNETVKERLSVSSDKMVTYPLKINSLVELPEDYSELINQVSSFTCPKSDGDESRAPTMCLACGKMLCSQSYCCQTEVEGVTCGAATEHAYSCGAGVGIFLRVRECQILLLAGKSKGCFVPPPYLDVYGETDQGLRRGNPLTLCRENYKSLEKLWCNHAVPETVAHNLETHTNLLTIDWQHL